MKGTTRLNDEEGHNDSERLSEAYSAGPNHVEVNRDACSSGYDRGEVG